MIASIIRKYGIVTPSKTNSDCRLFPYVFWIFLDLSCTNFVFAIFVISLQFNFCVTLSEINLLHCQNFLNFPKI